MASSDQRLQQSSARYRRIGSTGRSAVRDEVREFGSSRCTVTRTARIGPGTYQVSKIAVIPGSSVIGRGVARRPSAARPLWRSSTLAGTEQQRLVNGLVDQELTDRVDALDAAMKTLNEYTWHWS